MATFCIILEKAGPFLSELKPLYRDMDRAYHIAAAEYGFECHGCTDNCCLTRFYHHTFVEYAYLKSGFLMLPRETRSQLAATARQVAAAYEAQEDTEKIMCPLNQNGRCMVYDYRPMICRLHGIPNEMRRPDGVTLRGPGCPEFTRLHEEKPYVPFNRTPFYIKMATIERRLKETFSIEGKFKKTIAEMIVAIEDEV